jgi:hypothetical protein
MNYHDDGAVQNECLDRLVGLINGFQISQAIYVAVMLNIPDLLANGRRSSEEIAMMTECDGNALYRLMRALAAVGIITEMGNRTFELTALGAGLRTSAAESRRAWVAFALTPAHWAAWGNLLHGVRTGETPFRHVHGLGVWDYRKRHPAEGKLFDLAMRERSSCFGRELADHYDFGCFERIGDIGGGDGSLLAALLTNCPKATGVLFDLPHVVANATTVFSQAGVLDRSVIAAGDFFQEVPAGLDAYLLKHILHDWEDSEALSILRACRNGMKNDAKLLVIERLLAPPNHGLEGKLSDLNMLVNAGGRERRREEFYALLGEAGFSVTAIMPVGWSNHLIEAVPLD